MASLSLDFTGVGLGKSAGLQDLRAVGTASLHGQQQFLATDLLYCKNCMVLQGKIKSLEPSSSGPVERDVVCKYRDDDISLLEHEAGVYEGDLRELQGVAVPCFHGLFKGSYLLGSGKEKRIACIILDYIPSDRSWDLWDGPAETRVAIAHTMLQIHKAGVLQGDFADANILVSGSGDVRIVDFDQATHHDCQADPEMNVWNYEPSECEYGCGEMYDAIQALELWTPTIIPFSGSSFYIFSFPEPESLADFFLSRRYDREDPGVKTKIKRRAKEVLSQYYEKYGERFKDIGDPRDIKKKLDEHRT